MKKKWSAYGIAVLSFVALIMMGACGAINVLSPEEAAAIRQAQDERRKEAGVGNVTIENTSNDNYWVVQYWLVHTPKYTAVNYRPGRRVGAECSKSEYEVRYTICRTPNESFLSVTDAETQHWYKKTGKINPGGSVTVNIP